MDGVNGVTMTHRLTKRHKCSMMIVGRTVGWCEKCCNGAPIVKATRLFHVVEKSNNKTVWQVATCNSGSVGDLHSYVMAGTHVERNGGTVYIIT